MAESCQLKRDGKCCELGTKTDLIVFPTIYGRTMATIFDDDTSNNDVVNIEEE